MTSRSSTALVSQEQQHPIVAALEQRSDVIEALLPQKTHIERFKRVVLQSINRNPDLKKCTPNSIVDAAAEAARLGLEPSGAIGGAHLVPYGQTAQLIVDYRGLVELARRSGEIAAIDAAVVRQADRFRVRRGTEPTIEHEPDLDAATPADPFDEANPVTHVYAVARLRNGQRQFDVMSRDEVERIRSRSRAGNSGPWRTDWHEMAKKTVLRRLSKTLPLTVEVRAQLEMEDEIERPPVVVVDGGRSDRLGGLRGALRQRTSQLTSEEPQPQPAATEKATVGEAAKPARQKRGKKQPAQSEPGSAPTSEQEPSGDAPGGSAEEPTPAPAESAEAVPAEPDLSLEEATMAVYTAAANRGLLGDKSGDEAWAAIDQIAGEAIPDTATDDLTVADWLAIRDRINGGEFSPPTARPRSGS